MTSPVTGLLPSVLTDGLLMALYLWTLVPFLELICKGNVAESQNKRATFKPSVETDGKETCNKANDFDKWVFYGGKYFHII